MAPPHTFWRHGAWGVTAAIVVPMLLVALFVRLFGGQKPLR
jgi:hypothetical protein